MVDDRHAIAGQMLAADVKKSIGDDDGTGDVEQIIQAVRGGQSDQRSGISDQKLRREAVRRHRRDLAAGSTSDAASPGLSD